MLTVKVYETRNGKLIAKSKKYRTFKKAYTFVTPYWDKGMYHIEVHGKKAK